MADSVSEDARAALIERLNSSWRIVGPPPPTPTLTHALLQPIRRALARLLRPQETFNSQVVQYINASLSTIERYRWALDDVERFRAALTAREQRMEAAWAVMRAEHEELRTSIGVLQQATHRLAAEAARGPAQAASAVPRAGAVATGAGAGAPAGSAAPVPSPAEAPVPSPAEAPVPSTAEAPVPSTAEAMSHTYVGFEDQFRGSSQEIRARQEDYAQLFAGSADVLDIGCGRGEFLDLLRERGVSGRGIDLNPAMVDVCRSRGLDADTQDALAYLRGLPDGALGGLIALQVVEHLEPAYLTRLLDAAFAKLRPGSLIVLETINPACWFAFFESYIRDITHVRALHPDTLKFLLIAGGFQQVEIRYRAPYPEHDKLQPVSAPPPLADTVETLNANVEKLNRLLFTHLDYAAIGRRP